MQIDPTFRKIFSALQYGLPLPTETKDYWKLIIGYPLPYDATLNLQTTWDFKYRLIQLLTQWIDETCDIWNVVSLTSLSNRHSVLNGLKNSFQMCPPTLQIVFLTYTVHVRADLEIHWNELTQTTGYCRRTLERRIESGIGRFYEWLRLRQAIQ